MRHNMQKGFANVILIIIILAVAGVAGYWYVNWATAPAPTLTPPSTGVQTMTPVVNKTANWKMYRNEKYGFKFEYPNKYELVDKEDPDLPGAHLVIFSAYNNRIKSTIPTGLGIRFFSKTDKNLQDKFEENKNIFPNAKKLTINGFPALQQIVGNPGSGQQIQTVVFLEKSQYVLFVASVKTLDEQEYSTIMASFQLTSR